MAIILDKRATDTALDIACVASPEAGTPWNAIAPARPMLTVATIRFGALEVEEDLILALPEGLIGFEACRRFVVVRPQENSPFRWLQSLDEPRVAVPIIEPGEFRSDYAPTISDADARSLQLTPETPTLVFVIVTVPPRDPRAMTANLLAPVVINGLTRRGRQVIVQDEGYTTRHRIVDEMQRMAAPPTPRKGGKAA